MQSTVIQFRRDLHQIPEIRLELPETQAYLQHALKDLPCKLLEPIPYSVAAYFDNGKAETIAFRSDMDALQVEEHTGLAFASKHKGVMHACGHDGHMAMLLGFAHELSAYYQTLPHNVMLIFQPGEESPGGADPICATGLYQTYHIKRTFGLHIWPDLAKHVIASRSGEMMAMVSELHIELYGVGAHAAKYQEGRDAIEAGVAITHACYQMEKQLPKHMRRILRIGVFQGGSVLNVVSDHAKLEGTIRALDEHVYTYLCEQIAAICTRVQQESGVRCELTITKPYPVVYNDPTLFTQVSKVMDVTELAEPVMISEDFSYYQKQAPGIFFFLGTGGRIALHNDQYTIDEDVLETGIKAYHKLCRIK